MLQDIVYHIPRSASIRKPALLQRFPTWANVYQMPEIQAWGTQMPIEDQHKKF